jgi:hypothetical protein
VLTVRGTGLDLRIELPPNVLTVEVLAALKPLLDGSRPGGGVTRQRTNRSGD